MRGAGRRVAPLRRRAMPVARRMVPSREQAVPAAAFAALGAFAALHWSALVVDPPVWRSLAVVAIVTAGGLASATVRIPHGPRWTEPAARALVLLAAAVAAFAAMGLPPGLLWPAGWDRLGEGLARGLTGLRTLTWPYGGPDEWVRLTVLLAIPLVLSAAAALTFRRSSAGRPVSSGGMGARAAGLMPLLALYGVAVAQRDPGASLLEGSILLVLLSAWLFLPRLRRRSAPLAVAMLVAVLAVSLPLASGIAAEEPVIDYRSWRWVGEPTRYDWNHGYGPIDWPRQGESVLTVRSGRPHYWKAAALDHFDGLRWVRSTEGASAGRDPGIPPDAPRRWETEVEVTVGALDSTLLVTPGSIQEVEGAGTVTFTQDGVARAAEDLEQGESYTVRAYAPNPSVERMRTAPDPSPLQVGSATQVHLPAEGQTDLEALEGGAEPSAPERAVTLPRFSDGLGGSPGAAAYVADSSYGPVLRLARRLVDGAPTTYDAVKRIEAHLRSEYGYDEQPPEREYPLVSFLFEDRVGYCQHFSGAMALMLRMNGIPARVATGFAPGERDSAEDVYSVRDLDAHSWVEVHFMGVGWVPFDPTPAGAPTTARADGTLASAARGEDGESALDLSQALATGPSAPSEGASEPTSGTSPDGGAPGAGPGPPLWAAAVALVLALAAGGLLWRRGRRRPDGTDAPVRELERALRRLGHSMAPGTTLMDLERRLAARGRAAAARYVRRVREQRYAGGRRTADAGARRALRRALTEGAGAAGRLRGYVALPPRLAGFTRRR